MTVRMSQSTAMEKSTGDRMHPLDTEVHSERFCHQVIVHDLAFKALEQGLDDVHQFLRDSMVPHNLPERWSV